MPGEEVARKIVVFFLLTRASPVGILLILAIGMAIGVLPGGGTVLITAVPAVVATGAVMAMLGLRRPARWAEERFSQRGEDSRLLRLAPRLSATADGVDEALQQLRPANPLLLIGLTGFLVLDMLALWASFRAVGSAPELTLVWMAYLIGQLGNWPAVPGGIGGTKLGLIGAAVLYGLPVVTATAAVLLYRAIELWLPPLLGLVAFLQLRVLLAAGSSNRRVEASSRLSSALPAASRSMFRASPPTTRRPPRCRVAWASKQIQQPFEPRDALLAVFHELRQELACVPMSVAASGGAQPTK
jgi:uncharacterized membrane protein YbhN (UPF0104 family)